MSNNDYCYSSNMNKSFLIDAYLWTENDRQYLCSIEDDQPKLPMTLVCHRDIEVIDYSTGIATCYDFRYYLYKIEINSEVTYSDGGLDLWISYTNTKGVLRRRFLICSTDAYPRNTENAFRDLLDTEGYDVMRPRYSSCACLLRFKSPLVIIDNV